MNEKSIKTCQIHNENYNSIIQLGLRHPAARYLDASVYETFYFETYFLYFILFNLFRIILRSGS